MTFMWFDLMKATCVEGDRFVMYVVPRSYVATELTFRRYLRYPVPWQAVGSSPASVEPKVKEDAKMVVEQAEVTTCDDIFGCTAEAFGVEPSQAEPVQETAQETAASIQADEPMSASPNQAEPVQETTQQEACG
ncbi:hypothetical protein AK812_SmicGene36079, partial [Symbiodinium microadriaticum]